VPSISPSPVCSLFRWPQPALQCKTVLCAQQFRCLATVQHTTRLFCGVTVANNNTFINATTNRWCHYSSKICFQTNPEEDNVTHLHRVLD
jgi:hypothetical protein